LYLLELDTATVFFTEINKISITGLKQSQYDLAVPRMERRRADGRIESDGGFSLRGVDV